MSETVYISPTRARDSETRYHTDADCDWGPSNPQEWSRETAEAWGFEICDYCAGAVERGTPSDGHIRSLEAAAEANADD